MLPVPSLGLDSMAPKGKAKSGTKGPGTIRRTVVDGKLTGPADLQEIKRTTSENIRFHFENSRGSLKTSKTVVDP